jgi:hypothetical protein
MRLSSSYLSSSSVKVSALVLIYLILSLLISSSLKKSEVYAAEKNQDADRAVTLYAGYLTRIECDGRLLISAIGNESLARIEALPKEIGCGVLIKPLASSGQTNLIIETSSETYERILRVQPPGSFPGRDALSIRLTGGRR